MDMLFRILAHVPHYSAFLVVHVCITITTSQYYMGVTFWIRNRGEFWKTGQCAYIATEKLK